MGLCCGDLMVAIIFAVHHVVVQRQTLRRHHGRFPALALALELHGIAGVDIDIVAARLNTQLLPCDHVLRSELWPHLCGDVALKHAERVPKMGVLRGPAEMAAALRQH